HVELRTVVREERRVTAALFLLEDVHLAHELLVRRDRPRLREDLAALDVVLLDAAQQEADVVSRLPLVEELAEHLDPRDRGLAGVAEADDLDLLADLDEPALDAPRRDGAAALDREDVLDRHQERLVDVADGLRDLGVERREELTDLRVPLRVALERRKRRA